MAIVPLRLSVGMRTRFPLVWFTSNEPDQGLFVIYSHRGKISSSLKPLGSSDVKEIWGDAMFKRVCIAFIFVAAGGTIAVRAQADSTTAAGPSQNAPQAVPCARPDCPPQTHRSVSQESSPRSGAGTLIRGFTLSAPPPSWHAHSM
jgi:hypothetical protein